MFLLVGFFSPSLFEGPVGPAGEMLNLPMWEMWLRSLKMMINNKEVMITGR